ncbi:MAG: helix-turn-helix domain-containing protein [Lachnospiraceae bacterium]
MAKAHDSANNNLNIFRLLRIARDKKVKELADDLLVTPAYINAIEKGDRKPSERLIRDYAEALNVDEQIIKNFSENTTPNTNFEHFLLSLLQTICSLDDSRQK